MSDEQNTNEIFRQLKSSPISIVGSNGASNNWHFIINFRQSDDLNHSKEIEEIMTPVLLQYNLEIKRIWEEKK